MRLVFVARVAVALVLGASGVLASCSSDEPAVTTEDAGPPDAPIVEVQDAAPLPEAAADADAAPPVIVKLVAGGYSTCVLLSNGHVSCWGYGGSGELGRSSVHAEISDYFVP